MPETCIRNALVLEPVILWGRELEEGKRNERTSASKSSGRTAKVGKGTE